MSKRILTYERGLRAGSPTKAGRLHQLAGASRHVHNYMVDHLLMEIRTTGTCDARFYTLCKRLTILIRGTPWMRAYPVAVLRMPLRYLAADMARHRKDPANYSMPGKKNKHKSPCSFTVPEQCLKWNGDSLFIAKTGTWRVKGPPVPGEVREVTIKFELGEWRVFVRTVVDRPAREKTGKTVGIDRNAGNIAFHDGDAGAVVEPPARLAALWECARRRQRALSRLWSIRWKEAEAEAKADGRDRPRNPRPSRRMIRMQDDFRRDLRKIRRIVHDWRHKTTAELARKYDVIVLEDLNLKAMTAAGGRRKRGMNRGMREVGHGYMERMFEYKADAVIRIPAAYTSQRCSSCHHTEPDNRLGRKFKCRVCGHRDHADVNAASNVWALGTRATGLGSEGLGPPACDPPNVDEAAAA